MYLDLDWQKITIGDVTCEAKPLEFWAYQKVLALLNAGEMADEVAQSLASFQNPELPKLISDVLPKHVRNLEGIEIKIDGEKRAATVDDLVIQGAFLILAVQILVEIFNISTIAGSDDPGKKSEPSETPLLESSAVQ